MTKGRRHSWAIIAVPGVIACGGALTGIAAELPYASATNACAPADGPAVSIVWAARPVIDGNTMVPFVRVSLWTGVGDLAGKSFRVGPNSTEGVGVYIGRETARAADVVGTVRVDRVAADSSVTGAVDVTLSDGSRLTRDFSAAWFTTATLCG